ncbi:hypothetical protein CU097_005181 [Rhizopus azygosporus]|uniref:Uncharacterized protein n=1 Tax=Rhizopus azygosporus TaxID=86630 RepID=A0A367IWY6_RHIAZ|nr:hypothetical protein CU097_005181 [Rhizopus azygosporus]
MLIKVDPTPPTGDIVKRHLTERFSKLPFDQVNLLKVLIFIDNKMSCLEIRSSKKSLTTTPEHKRFSD